MNSHNHPAFASIGSWLYRHVAGLRLGKEPLFCASPELDFPGGGFEYTIVGPRAVEDSRITGATAQVRSTLGVISASWQMYVGTRVYLTVNVELPVGSKGEVRFPKVYGSRATDVEITEGGVLVFSKGSLVRDKLPLGVRNGCIARETSGEQVIVLQIDSGRYEFELIPAVVAKQDEIVV